MKGKLTVLTVLLCLLLCGCSSWMDGSYVSVKPHMERPQTQEQTLLAASNEVELLSALVRLVESGAETGMISVAAMEAETVEDMTQRALDYVMKYNPIASYAVDSIDYELGAGGGQNAIAVNITYTHGRGEIRQIKQADSMEEARSIITNALDQCEAGVVLKVEGYVQTDFAQLVQDYAEENPESVIELPQVTANVYPEGGTARVVELIFGYQTSRETLRSMQDQVRKVFRSAELYVSGGGSEHEKYSQLYSFLMERYDYRLETSITPPYSLLCYGVGDSKAFAVCYAAMCRRAGLECLVLSGTRDGESHFWNMVCDEGVYYHVDLLEVTDGGSFRERTDGEMEGYVWDYSAYPEGGAGTEAVPEPTE